MAWRPVPLGECDSDHGLYPADDAAAVNRGMSVNHVSSNIAGVGDFTSDILRRNNATGQNYVVHKLGVESEQRESRTCLR